MINFFTQLVQFIGGGGELSGAKLSGIFWGIFLTAIFIAVFAIWFLKTFKENARIKKLFFVSSGILFAVIAAKYALFHFYRGYIPDRLFLYAVPSPKILSFWWFMAPLAVFGIFMHYRERVAALKPEKFLCVLYAFVILFTLSVAGAREGTASIADPFTRTEWEYTGNLPLIHSTREFLHDYAALIPKLAAHSTTHPPGYTLVLYFFQQLFGVQFLGMAALLVVLSGLVIFPLYALFRQFFSEEPAKRAIQIFTLVPSAVMMTATSMEAFLLFSVWGTISACAIGWRKSFFIAALGGLGAAISLFSNYLFLLLGPFFAALLIYILMRENGDRGIIAARAATSMLAFALFFYAIYVWSGYSIIGNFFAARAANAEVVKSNFESIWIYLIYFGMNISAFSLYLGLPNLMEYFKALVENFKKSPALFKAGVATVILFLMIGIFQGEVERLWLFIVPFFVAGTPVFLEKKSEKEFSGFLSLLFFQIIVTQTLFYTYW